MLCLASAPLLMAVLSSLQVADQPEPAPSALIDQLVTNAAQYRLTLPSLTADESISSESSYLGLFKLHAEAQGTFRVMASAAGGALQESRHITRLNGKPVEPGKHVTLPSTLFGGFDRFEEMFFTPQHRLCFAFTLLPQPAPDGTLQIAIAVPPEVEERPGCTQDRQGLTGLARVDPATHQIVHLERTVPDELARRSNLAPFASVDCAPARVGGQTFWLPTMVVGRILDGKVRGEFTAHYSNYHRYTASITLLPGASEVDSTPPPH
jgi:hypothetical protein